MRVLHSLLTVLPSLIHPYCGNRLVTVLLEFSTLDIVYVYKKLKMAAPIKIQIFGHSFVSRLRLFIRDEENLRYDLGLHNSPLVQYSGYPGANVNRLISNLEVVTDFGPDILVVLVGTNDLYKPDITIEDVASGICQLVRKALFE